MPHPVPYGRWSVRGVVGRSVTPSWQRALWCRGARPPAGVYSQVRSVPQAGRASRCQHSCCGLPTRQVATRRRQRTSILPAMSGPSPPYDSVMTLRALCDGNTPVDSLHKGLVSRSMFFFIVSQHKLLNKQSSCWCSETPWRSFDVTIAIYLKTLTSLTAHTFAGVSNSAFEKIISYTYQWTPQIHYIALIYSLQQLTVPQVSWALVWTAPVGRPTAGTWRCH